MPLSAALAVLVMSQQRSVSARHALHEIVLPPHILFRAENPVVQNCIEIKLDGSPLSLYRDNIEGRSTRRGFPYPGRIAR